MIKLEKLKIQENIKLMGFDGWLLYDFRKNNDLACRFLEIPATALLTRRFFYWIPAQGIPMKVVHRIESHVLEHLPGLINVYSTYEELEEILKKILKKSSIIAMEYSPKNAIPTLSKVDAGTIDLIRSFGIHVESSGDLIQPYTSVWTLDQFTMHKEAASLLQEIVEKTWIMISESFKKNLEIDEHDIQQSMLKHMENAGFFADDLPICAVNEHSANPHYSPKKKSSKIIRPGDFILLDLWCKKKVSHAVYADITRVGVIGKQPSTKQKEIFGIVKAGRDAAIDFIKQRLLLNLPIYGWEADQCCRETIKKAGYGLFFTHRTGHNIGEKDHGDGANIDDYETKELRQLLPGTCFSIEPGIYLPGEFGIRLEDDVYLELDGKNLHITEGQQQEIFCLVNHN